jgi:hypothetical protein
MVVVFLSSSSSSLSSSSSSYAHTYTCARARNCQKESRTKKMRVYVVYERYFFFGFRRPLPCFLKKGAHNLPLHHTKKTRTTSKHNIHQIIQNTKKKNGLSRSRTKEKVGSGAVGGGEIETTEHALVRAIVRH